MRDKMTDSQLILFLLKILRDEIEGSFPSHEEFETIERELKIRGIDPNGTLYSNF